jgi:hypothetical protein
MHDVAALQLQVVRREVYRPGHLGGCRPFELEATRRATPGDEKVELGASVRRPEEATVAPDGQALDHAFQYETLSGRPEIATHRRKYHEISTHNDDISWS